MAICSPASLDREAIELNRASEDALPMTFVDYAEMVWRKSAGGSTQQAIADELGWIFQQVSQYALLQKINRDAWGIISTTIQSTSCIPSSDAVDENSTVVEFTERLLRSIIPLTPSQQIELITELANGKIDKKKFKRDAESYRTRNDAEAFVRAQLGEIDADMIEEATR